MLPAQPWDWCLQGAAPLGAGAQAPFPDAGHRAGVRAWQQWQAQAMQAVQVQARWHSPVPVDAASAQAQVRAAMEYLDA